jgi:phosphoglycolate phosphatase-like HAD superfamily hydrolase
MKSDNSKLILFDIDGTLLTTHGIPRRAMRRVLQKMFNNHTYDDEYNYSGRTDWEIVEHLLDFAGIDYPRTKKTLNVIFEEFAYELKVEIRNGLTPQLYIGVLDLLESLAKDSCINLGLVTGNISKGAYLKLKAIGLDKYFPIGAFGDDAKERSNLPGIAIKRAEKYFRKKISKKNIWIVGDSIYDIHCAQVNDLRCLAVCTGLTSRDKLENENPEFIVDDFQNTEKVLNIFFNNTSDR